MSADQSAFWFSLGFDPENPADWAAMSAAAADADVSSMLESFIS
jgi:hypothetical protein